LAQSTGGGSYEGFYLPSKKVEDSTHPGEIILAPKLMTRYKAGDRTPLNQAVGHETGHVQQYEAMLGPNPTMSPRESREYLGLNDESRRNGVIDYDSPLEQDVRIRDARRYMVPRMNNQIPDTPEAADEMMKNIAPGSDFYEKNPQIQTFSDEIHQDPEKYKRAKERMPGLSRTNTGVNPMRKAAVEELNFADVEPAEDIKPSGEVAKKEPSEKEALAKEKTVAKAPAKEKTVAKAPARQTAPSAASPTLESARRQAYQNQLKSGMGKTKQDRFAAMDAATAAAKARVAARRQALVFRDEKSAPTAPPAPATLGQEIVGQPWPKTIEPAAPAAPKPLDIVSAPDLKQSQQTAFARLTPLRRQSLIASIQQKGAPMRTKMAGALDALSSFVNYMRKEAAIGAPAPQAGRQQAQPKNPFGDYKTITPANVQTTGTSAAPAPRYQPGAATVPTNVRRPQGMGNVGSFGKGRTSVSLNQGGAYKSTLTPAEEGQIAQDRKTNATQIASEQANPNNARFQEAMQGNYSKFGDNPQDQAMRAQMQRI
ncbi:MAG: hypothetical protein NTZ98_23305, partial [Acidobacteria bacterium]|nr:hypothetical protein [Acidobacteriota bacterium]